MRPTSIDKDPTIPRHILLLGLIITIAGCGKSVEELEAELLYGSRNQRLEAAEELGERGIIEVLVLGLQDDDPAVRKRVVEELSTHGETVITPVLELMDRRPNNIDLLVAGIEVLEAVGGAAREGVVQSGLIGGPPEVDLAFRILRRLPEADKDIDLLLADTGRRAWLLQSQDPTVRLEVLDYLVLSEIAELEVLLKLFSNDTVDLYTLSPELDPVPEPLPGAEGFGPPGAGIELLNNFTALELELLIHRRELEQYQSSTPEPMEADYYEIVPWAVFIENTEAGIERCLATDASVEGMTRAETADLCRHLSQTFSMTAESHPDPQGSLSLLRYAELFGASAAELDDGGVDD